MMPAFLGGVGGRWGEGGERRGRGRRRGGGGGGTLLGKPLQLNTGYQATSIHPWLLPKVTALE